MSSAAAAAAATAAAVRCRWVTVEVLSFNSCRTSMVAYLQRVASSPDTRRRTQAGRVKMEHARCQRGLARELRLPRRLRLECGSWFVLQQARQPG